MFMKNGLLKRKELDLGAETFVKYPPPPPDECQLLDLNLVALTIIKAYVFEVK